MKVHRLVVVGWIAGLAACAVGPGYRTPKPDLPPPGAVREAI